MQTWTIPTTYQCDDKEDQKDSDLQYVEVVEKSKYDAIKRELETALHYLRVGKAKFTPHTTNSDVDMFIEKHSNSWG